MKIFKIMPLFTLLLISISTGQANTQSFFYSTFYQDTQLENDISSDDVISFEDATNGTGNLYITYALWSSDGKNLLSERIIPLSFDGTNFVPQWNDNIELSTSAPEEFWKDFSEYGFSVDDIIGENDRATYIKTRNAAPNLNFYTDDGNIASLNLVYIGNSGVSLVAHTEIIVKKVFDASVMSISTADELRNWYRPDESEILLKSHFSISPQGELTISTEENIWAKSSDGLYILQDNGKFDENAYYIGYNRNEKLSIACLVENSDDDNWSAVVYASPQCGETAVLEDIDGVNFSVDKTMWFGDAVFSGAAPVPSQNAYSYRISTFEQS
ncbi:hypothetical protein DRQ26_05110, partial [bacterium]